MSCKIYDTTVLRVYAYMIHSIFQLHMTVISFSKQ